jgi:hypothetical protein
MQIIKYLLFLIVLSVVSIAIYILTLETKFNISNNYTVNIKKVYVKNYFNDILNWENISNIQQKDTLAVANNTFKIQNNISLKLDSVSSNLSLFSVYLKGNNIGNISYQYTDSINKFTNINANFYGEVSFFNKVSIFLKGISPRFYFNNLFTDINVKMQKQLITDFDYKSFFPIKVVYIPKKYFYKSRFTNPTLSREEIVKAYYQVKKDIGDEHIADNTFYINMIIDEQNRKEYYIGIPVTQKLAPKIGPDIFLDSLQTDKVLKTGYGGDIQFEKKYTESVKKQVEQQNLNIDFNKKINVWNNHLKHSNPKNWTFETWYYVIPEVKKISVKTDKTEIIPEKEIENL